MFKEAEQILIDCMKVWMPDFQTKTYFIPDIFMNRVPCEKDIFAGQEVMIWKKPDGSNLTEKTQETPREEQKEQMRKDSITHCSSVQSTLKDADSADLTQGTSEKTQEKLERKDHTIHCTGMWSTLKGPTQLKPVQDCYIRDDRAQQHVLYCLRKWADIHLEEVMVVLSQLQYSDYLSKPSFAELVKHLPKPRDMKSCRGDFDVLIIHKQFGIIVLEIKSIGINADELNLQDSDQVNEIRKKVEKGIEQLTKAERVLSHLVNDMETEIFIRKSIILPYVTTSQLRQAVIRNEDTGKARKLYVFYFFLNILEYMSKNYILM